MEIKIKKTKNKSTLLMEDYQGRKNGSLINAQLSL